MSSDSRSNMLGSDINNPVDAKSIANKGIQTSNVMKDDFGLDIPAEHVPIPSRGVIYPADTNLHNKETVEIRPMTAREEDILTSRALIKKGTVLTELVKSCLIDKSIDPEMLISGDRNAVMVALRITGYGADYEVEVECPECDEKSKQMFDLSDLSIKRLSVEPVVNGANIFEIKLPVSRKVARVKFLTGHDEREILITSERKKKSGLGGDSVITDRLIRSIVSIGDITDKNKITMFVKNLPVRDSHTIRKFLDTNEPGIDMKAWMSCPHCHESSEVKLPMGASFFWPDTE